MMRNTADTENVSEELREKLARADAVLIGAGAGLSVSAGFTYDGERFQKNFADFEKKYGFHDMYTGGFCRFESLEEQWAYWSRFIFLNRYTDPPKLVYQDLYNLVRDMDYFVLTTNVDHCFQKAGFDKKRLFYTQGDYGLWQCSKACHQKTYDNEETVGQMVRRQENMAVPSELVPYCPVCGEPMTMNLRSDNLFVQDEGWYAAAGRYDDFVRRHRDVEILYIELGVGMNTPSIIKYPFWQMTYQNPKAFYICINYGEAYAPREIAQRSVCINRDIGEVIKSIQ